MTTNDFQIRWRLTPRAWREMAALAKANPRGSYLDRNDHTIDLMVGQLQVWVGGEPLLEESVEGRSRSSNGQACSVLAVALQLAKQKHLIFTYQNGEVARVRGIDSGAFLSAHKYADQVIVSSLPPQGVRRVACSVDGYLKGIQRYIDEVIVELDKRSPGILSWETLDDLFYFRPIDQPDLWQREFRAVPPTEKFRLIPEQGPFQICWAMFDTEWATIRRERAINPPGSQLDKRLTTAEYLFGGYIRLLNNGSEIPIPTSIYRNISPRLQVIDWLPDHLREGFEPPDRVWTMLDLALQLSRFIRPEDFRKTPRGQNAKFDDPMRFLAFGEVESYGAQILPARLEVIRDSVGQPLFDSTARAFLEDFATVIHRRVPEAFDWWSLQPLRRYIHGEGNAE